MPPASFDTSPGPPLPAEAGLEAPFRRRVRSPSPGVSITTLAERTSASVRAVRYYEEIGLLKPLRIGQGLRRFSPEQSDIASTIVFLRQLDVPIADIRPLIDPGLCSDQRQRDLTALLTRKREALDARSAALEKALEGLGF